MSASRGRDSPCVVYRSPGRGGKRGEDGESRLGRKEEVIWEELTLVPGFETTTQRTGRRSPPSGIEGEETGSGGSVGHPGRRVTENGLRPQL